MAPDFSDAAAYHDIGQATVRKCIIRDADEAAAESHFGQGSVCKCVHPDVRDTVGYCLIASDSIRNLYQCGQARVEQHPSHAVIRGII